MTEITTNESPATLVAIIVAARRAGDRELERQARRKLQDRFGVKLNFAIAETRQGGASDAYRTTSAPAAEAAGMACRAEKLRRALAAASRQGFKLQTGAELERKQQGASRIGKAVPHDA
jgi:hypothetical protein